MSSVSSRTVLSLDELEPGDHIKWPTWWLVNDHHAIVVEVITSGRHVVRIKVVHYTSSYDQTQLSSSSAAEIKEELVDLDDYVRQGQLEVLVYRYGCFSEMKTVAMARSRVGEVEYNLVKNNCEHFARWCKTGQSRSEQVENAATNVAVGAAIGGLLLAGYGLYKLFEKSDEEERQKKVKQADSNRMWNA